MADMTFTRPLVTAKRVLRAEGQVFRYDVASDQGRTWHGAYDLLRYHQCGDNEARGILDDADRDALGVPDSAANID